MMSLAKTPEQLRGAYKTRYDLYKKTMPAFKAFNDCVNEWLDYWKRITGS
jgi:hypothetical protein